MDHPASAGTYRARHRAVSCNPAHKTGSRIKAPSAGPATRQPPAQTAKQCIEKRQDRTGARPQASTGPRHPVRRSAQADRPNKRGSDISATAHRYPGHSLRTTQRNRDTGITRVSKTGATKGHCQPAHSRNPATDRYQADRQKPRQLSHQQGHPIESPYSISSSIPISSRLSRPESRSRCAKKDSMLTFEPPNSTSRTPIMNWLVYSWREISG